MIFYDHPELVSGSPQYLCYMKVDYIIVGCGLAGIAFCEQLRKYRKSYIVFDDGSQQSSKVAGGLYNPVNLKRFTPAWNVDLFFQNIDTYYGTLEAYLNVSINKKLEILRAFVSVEEQNNWFAASDKPILSKYLYNGIVKNENAIVNAQYGYGKVLHSGKIDTQILVTYYLKKLQQLDVLVKEKFEYNSIEQKMEKVVYKNIEASKIIFSEGFGLKHNPYFNYLPLTGNKGEYIVVEAPDLNIEFALKGTVFVIPIKENTYLVGATYSNQDKTQTTTKEKYIELVKNLKKLIHCDFKVIGQRAAIRPTILDRKPLVGEHPKHKNLCVLNGLGTRGVMASPYIAEQLYQHIENSGRLNSEIDIKRYQDLLVS